MTLKADEVRFNRETQGHSKPRAESVVDDPEWKFRSADSMQYEHGDGNRRDSRTATCFLEDGHVSMSRPAFPEVWRSDLSRRRRIFYYLSLRIREPVVEIFRGANGPYVGRQSER